MNPVTPGHAAWLVRKVCAQHVEEQPADQSQIGEVMRAVRSCAALTAAIGARVNPIYMEEVIRLFEELHEVKAGTHEGIRQNAALTVNNVPALEEALQGQISDAIADLLAHTEPLQVREGAVA